MFDPLTTLIIALAYVATIIIGGSLVVHGTITIGNLVTFITYLAMMVWPIFAVGMLFNTLERGNASYDRVMHLLNEKPEVSLGNSGRSAAPEGDLNFAIQQFQYPGDDQPSLHDVTFSVKQGQTLGIVGRVGSGKSTIMRLILRQFEHYQGRIRMAGDDIRDYQLDAYLPAIGYVPQDSFLFSDSVRENIAFARPDATMAEVEAVAEKSDLAHQISQFPDGYETQVGEDGISLSGGQRQRLAIARALMIDPELLILDDALSAVDAETESQILGQLRADRQHKTTIIAAHRLSSVMHADEIIVMDGGHIVERGDHASLMAGNAGTGRCLTGKLCNSRLGGKSDEGNKTRISMGEITARQGPVSNCRQADRVRETVLAALHCCHRFGGGCQRCQHLSPDNHSNLHGYLPQGWQSALRYYVVLCWFIFICDDRQSRHAVRPRLFVQHGCRVHAGKCSAADIC